MTMEAMEAYLGALKPRLRRLGPLLMNDGAFGFYVGEQRIEVANARIANKRASAILRAWKRKRREATRLEARAGLYSTKTRWLWVPLIGGYKWMCGCKHGPTLNRGPTQCTRCGAERPKMPARVEFHPRTRNDFGGR